MNVLYLTHYFPPEGNAPASRVYEICRRWVDKGHQVTVITCAPNVPNGVVYRGYRNRLFQREKIAGIDVIRVWTFLAANKGVGRRILNYVSFMVSAFFGSMRVTRPHLVIATSPQFFCGWAGVFVAAVKRRPFILEIRDLWPESIVAVGAIRQKRVIRFLEWMEKRLYRLATKIVTVGEGYRKRLEERGVDGDRIAVVTNGVDTSFFAPCERDDALADRLGVRKDFVCAYAGTIGMACGLDIVLRAAARLQEKGDKNIKFLLIGDGAERERLQEDAIATGLDGVIFTGRADKANMPALLALSDVCLVHLRKADLFQTVLPSKMFEAAAMKKPVILGVEGSAAEILTAAESGICIEPDNDEQLVAAVEKMAADTKLCKTMGAAGYDWVSKHYDYDRLAEQYETVLANVSKTI